MNYQQHQIHCFNCILPDCKFCQQYEVRYPFGFLDNVRDISRLTIILQDLPPTVNHFYMRRSHFTFIGQKGLDYIDYVKETVRESKMKHLWISFYKPIKVYIELYPSDRRRRDIDNLLKPLLDSFTKAGVWNDDSQIKDLRIVMKNVVPIAYTKVFVETIEPSDA